MIPVTPSVWTVDIGEPGGEFTQCAISNRFVEAWDAYTDTQVHNGMRKRLLRNGRVIYGHTATRTRKTEQLTLPVAQ